MFQPKIAELVHRNPRYPYEAYEFVLSALERAQRSIAPARATTSGIKTQHVSGKQLLEAARSLAVREFGLLARTVLRIWGVERTQDIGEIVFNLAAVGVLSMANEDQREEYADVFDLDEALSRDFAFECLEAE